jgi:hypothetical protein
VKILPCLTCRASALAARRPEILMTLGQMVDPVLHFRCARCSRMQRVTAAEYSALPEMSEPELRARNCDLFPHPDRPALRIPFRREAVKRVDPTSTTDTPTPSDNESP